MISSLRQFMLGKQKPGVATTGPHTDHGPHSNADWRTPNSNGERERADTLCVLLSSSRRTAVWPQGGSVRSISVAAAASSHGLKRRYGFTLIELLVSITILTILMITTYTVVSRTIDGDRVRSGSRQLQSMLEGARNRAIFTVRNGDPQPRGVRLLVDESNPATSRSFVFIGSPGSYSEGTLKFIEENAGDNGNLGDALRTDFQSLDVTHMTDSSGANWQALYERGVIVNGTRIYIVNPTDSTTGFWFTVEIADDGADPPQITAIRITKDYNGTFALAPDYEYDYKLLLAPEILPNEDPRQLPNNVVIDLASMYVAGKLPSGWVNVVTDNAGAKNDTIEFSDRMDILFSPRGTIYGSLAAEGLISFVISDARDIGVYNFSGNQVALNDSGFTVDEQTVDDAGVATAPSDTSNARRGDEIIMTLATQTGNVFSSPPDLTDADTNGYRDDPFLIAETGGEAK
ncbi:pilus assembly FimT family protein [Calycomorphotria hydatis]|uniref:Prepilin-type N-terminal cleavage/methylation domain-containing protein n=1 Tax=Calycomorphotria hydatis TaxID=2528027 RepID=A0A517T5X0_9PLAN|nr:prepilin-type N-terminal cleavage/methylation domain-containing protein [Calycomorphotria hydatis]QDT63758.1 hypothetical protein V22_09830 [Calycomorphotria hydatis]